MGVGVGGHHGAWPRSRRTPRVPAEGTVPHQACRFGLYCSTASLQACNVHHPALQLAAPLRGSPISHRHSFCLPLRCRGPSPQCYLPDLITLEHLGLVMPGTLVLADNVLVPGAPDYLQHVGASTLGGSGSSGGGSADGSRSSSITPGGGGREGAGGGDGADGGLAYRTELRYTAFEVEERYKKDWQPKRDAMSVSRCL